MHLPDADEPPGAELVLLDPDTLEDEVVAELGASALFGARFRENAARALLIPRAYPGRRTPLWQQRLKAQSLLEVARRYADFPIVLETYRECLRDVLDVPGLQELLRALHSRELSLVEVETPTASPFASALLFDYVATYMYEGDTPNAERRAAALSLDRDLLRELLGQEELRDLIDPGALDEVEADLQHRSDRTRASSSDALGDVLRRARRPDERRGAGPRARGPRRRRVPRDAAPRAPRDHRAPRRRGTLDRRRRRRPLPRRASAAFRRAGCPEAFLADVATGLEQLVARYARTHGPFTSAEVRRRYGVDASSALARAGGAPATLVRGELRPGGQRARVVRRRRAAAPAPRLARRAASRDRGRGPPRARELPAELAGRRPPAGPVGRRGRPPARGARAAPGARAARPTSGSATSCRGASAPIRRPGSTS